MKTRDSGFILTLIAIAAVIAVVVYMFLMRPAFDATEEARSQLEEAEAFNDNLELRLAQYESEFAKLPETREQIAVIQEQLAPQEDVAEVRRIIDEILTTEGLTLRTDSIGIPVLVTPGSVVLEPAAQAVGRSSTTDQLTFQNLYYTNFDLEFTGPHDNVVRALARIQMHDGRYFMVSSFEMTPNEDLADGTVTANVVLQFFTLVDWNGAIDPGTNTGNIDPETGEPLPLTPPESAFISGSVPPAPAPSPSVSPSDDAAESEG